MVSLWLHRVRRGFMCEEGFELSGVYLEGTQRTQFSSIQSLSLTLCNPMVCMQHTRPPCPSPTPRVYPLMSIESVMPSNHLILCRLLLLLSSIFHSIRVFSNESALCIRWPKYWSFSFISLSNEHSSVQFSCSVVSDSLRPHESQHTRPPCPSPTPGVH